MALTDAQKDAIIVAEAFGNCCYKVTLAEGCRKGDALGYSSGWKRALATTGTAIQCKCIALEDGVTGAVIAVSSHCIIGGRFSANTIGGSVYAAEGTSNGQYTQTAPTTGGDCNTIIGVALSATEVLFFPGNRVESVG